MHESNWQPRRSAEVLKKASLLLVSTCPPPFLFIHVALLIRLLRSQVSVSALSASRAARAVARVLPRREFGQARHELAVGGVGRCAALNVDGDGAATPGEAAVACQN